MLAFLGKVLLGAVGGALVNGIIQVAVRPKHVSAINAFLGGLPSGALAGAFLRVAVLSPYEPQRWQPPVRALPAGPTFEERLSRAGRLLRLGRGRRR